MLLLGGSLVIGRSVRLAISGGWACGKVSVLQGEKPMRQLLNEPLATRQVSRIGSFMSVGVAMTKLPGMGGKDSTNEK